MKINLLLFVFLSLSITAAAQAFESDNNLQYPFPFIKERSPSNDHVTRFSYGILKYRSTTSCIEFDFNIIGNIRSARPDSIILESSDHKELALKTPYRDTIYIMANGSLQVAVIFFLGAEALDFLKNNLIGSVVIIIDNNRSYVNLIRKNRTRLKNMISPD